MTKDIVLYWPVTSPVITQRFGDRVEYYRECCGLRNGHEGLDFRCRTGDPVLAMADGTVEAISDGSTGSRAYGVHVKIGHKYGWKTLYGHLSAGTVLVRVGDKVKGGQVIAAGDNTGNSSAAHLHVNLYNPNGTLVDPLKYLEPYPYNGSDPKTAGRPDYALRSIHGEGAAHWLLTRNLPGWAIEPVYSQGDLVNIPSKLDYSLHAKMGIRVILTVRYSYARNAPGGLGTYPARAAYDDFAEWITRIAHACRGVRGIIVGNEPNNPVERPDWSEDNAGTVIPPSDCAYLTNLVWSESPKEMWISPPPVDPTTDLSGDPLEYWRSLLADLKTVEFTSYHAYSYGTGQSISDPPMFETMPWQYYGFPMWEPLAAAQYETRFRRVPMLITETNPGADGSGWDGPDAANWVRKVYNYVVGWNRGPGAAYVHGGPALFRYEGDPVYSVKDRREILDALAESGAVAL